MNRVFESFVRVALEDKFATEVSTQHQLDYLFRHPSRLKQLPDYLWRHHGRTWIGDAKWKLLAGQISEEEAESGATREARLSPADVRQLTTYAELLYRQTSADGSSPVRPELAVFYPGVGANVSPQVLATWNDTYLHLVPMSVSGWESPQDALPNVFDS